MRILVTGSIAYDIFLGYDGSFLAGIKDAEIDSFSVGYVTPRVARHHGGTAINIAWNLRLLGQDPLVVGSVGEDGGPYLALLRERRIDTTHVETVPNAATAMAIIATDSRSHQITFYHPGADAQGSFPDLADLREEIGCAIISPRDPTPSAQAQQWCVKHKLPYIYDPGQQILYRTKQEVETAVRDCGGIVVNEYECTLLCSALDCSIADIARAVPFLIVTQGDKGFTIHEKDMLPRPFAACTPERVVNPTGAGDAFRAGLLTGLSKQWSLDLSAQLGSALASFVVEQEGALLDTLDLDEVLLRAKMTYGMEVPMLS